MNLARLEDGIAALERIADALEGFGDSGGDVERRRLELESGRLADEVRRRDAVLDWLQENMPNALDLCPYKVER